MSRKRIAVTGGLACGKTTVCQIFRDLGAHVVNADEIVHQLLTPQTEVGKQVIALFGEKVSTGSKIDRNKIALRVFREPEMLKKLEAVVHPAVRQKIEEEKEKAERLDKLFIVEVPLLYEAKMDSDFDEVIVVACEQASAQKRFERSAYEFKLRSDQQMKLEDKISKAHHVIRNDGSLIQLKSEVQKLYNQLI